MAPAAEAAVHNAWQVLIAQLMGMLGREDGARLASTATGLLSSHFDEVLEQGRVPDAVVVVSWASGLAWYSQTLQQSWAWQGRCFLAAHRTVDTCALVPEAQVPG